MHAAMHIKSDAAVSLSTLKHPVHSNNAFCHLLERTKKRKKERMAIIFSDDDARRANTKPLSGRPLSRRKPYTYLLQLVGW